MKLPEENCILWRVLYQLFLKAIETATKINKWLFFFFFPGLSQCEEPWAAKSPVTPSMRWCGKACPGTSQKCLETVELKISLKLWPSEGQTLPGHRQAQVHFPPRGHRASWGTAALWCGHSCGRPHMDIEALKRLGKNEKLAKRQEAFEGFPGGSAGKESTCNEGDLGLIPELGRSPGEGKGYPLQCSGLEDSMKYNIWSRKESGTTERLSCSAFNIWLQSLWSSRSHESWAQAWKRLASSLPCWLTIRTWWPKSMKWSSRWRSCCVWQWLSATWRWQMLCLCTST